MSGLYDHDGNHVEALEDWLPAFADTARKRVASTVLPDSDVWVSTVWLGVDFGAAIEGHEPMIYETRVSGYRDEYARKWATRESALEGHVATVLALLPPEARGAFAAPSDVPLDDPVPGTIERKRNGS